ncbi:MAG TPA: response regulator, partial [Chitinophagaceae bacterium]
IHRSGSDLLDLINDMLDLSKIEAGKIDLHIEEVKTEDIEHDIKELFAEVAKEKKIDFITEIQPLVPEFIQTDRQRLEQILKNLLSNAFKFTPANGEVKMIFSLPGNDNVKPINPQNKNWIKTLSIAVIDTGIGIPADKQELIFEAFQQVDGSTSRKYGGTGLGLSICRELINKLGGEMQLKSKEGEGSMFTIFLPVEAKIKSVENAGVKEENKSTNELVASLPSPKIIDDRENIDTDDKVVLIIEDDVQFALLLRDFARDHHYKAIVALQGDEGLLYARKYKPNAIILDIKLPVIDGWTLLKLLKDDEKLKHVPVHIITGTDYIKAAPGNVTTYLKKPVDKQDLDNTFESLVENSLSRFKKLLLILSGDNINKDSLANLIQKRQFDIECTYVNNVEEGIQQLIKNNFDCIIADGGSDLDKAKSNLKKLKENTSEYNIPVIVYIDADISQTDELELMKLSDVVIRNAEQSKNRLMDEVELFLYKIKEEKSELEPGFMAATDKIFDNKKVLLVDDDMRNVFVLSNILEENKMKVTAAVNGKDAIEELKKHPEINIILMDIMMPEMDGYQTMQKIRNELGFMNLPIIALTAKAMQGDREKCIRAGASDYISKPVDINKLLSLMRVWLSQQK